MSQDLRSGLVELTSRLVQFPSVNPPGYTVNVASFIRDWLSGLGFSSEFREYAKDKPNVIAKVGRGRPVLILNGHMDVVPPGDESRWVYPPFSGKVVEGKIYGRGATDMKGGLAVIMTVFAELAPIIEKQGSGTLIFSATADEESLGHTGVEALVKDGILVGDAAIIAEPTGSSRYCIGERGVIWVKLIARGKSAHASIPILGENAIMKLVKAIIKIEELVNEFNKGVKVPSELIEIIKNSAEVYMETAKSLGLNLSLNDFENVFNTMNFTPAVIRGGSKINVVPDYVELELDLRVPPGASTKQEIDYLKNKLSDIVDIEIMDLSEPNYTSLNEPIVKLVHEGIEKVLGTTPKPIIVAGTTDAKHLRPRGIPTVVYGPGELSLAHVYNEYVTVDDLLRAHDVMIYVIKRFFGLKK